MGLLSEAETRQGRGGRQIEGENLGPRLLKQGIGAGQEVTQARGLAHHRGQTPVDRSRAHGQNFPAPGHPLRHIADAVMRKAPNRPFLTALTGDRDDRVARQGGKKPVGDPPGATPAGPLGAPRIGFVLRLTGGAPTGQSGCATFAPNSATGPPGPPSPGWTTLRAPVAEWLPAALSVAVFCPPAAGLLMLAVPQRLTEFHSGARAYAPLDGKHCPEYTANELVRHGTSEPTIIHGEQCEKA